MNREEFRAFMRRAGELFPRVKRFAAGRGAVEDAWFRVLSRVDYQDAVKALDRMVEDDSLLPASTEAFPAQVLRLSGENRAAHVFDCPKCGGTGFVPICDPRVAHAMIARKCDCLAAETITSLSKSVEQGHQ